MLSKTRKAVGVGVVALGLAASGIGTTTVAAGIAGYLASPQPMMCDGNCWINPQAICGMNGQNFPGYSFSPVVQ
jgi:hypothetical protein